MADEYVPEYVDKKALVERWKQKLLSWMVFPWLLPVYLVHLFGVFTESTIEPTIIGFFFFFHGHLKTKINIPYCSYFGHVLLYICVRTSAFDRKRLVTWMPVYVRISDCAEWWVVRRKLKLNMVTTPSRTESKKLSRQLLILLKEMDPKAGMILGTDLVFSPRSFFLLSFIFYLVFFMPFIFLSLFSFISSFYLCSALVCSHFSLFWINSSWVLPVKPIKRRQCCFSQAIKKN